MMRGLVIAGSGSRLRSTSSVPGVAGVVLIAVGLAWPWLSKLGLSGNRSRHCSTSCIHAVVRLPGDIVIERESYDAQGCANAARGRKPRAARLFIPITSMMLISLVLSLLFWLFRR